MVTPFFNPKKTDKAYPNDRFGLNDKESINFFKRINL